MLELNSNLALFHKLGIRGHFYLQAASLLLNNAWNAGIIKTEEAYDADLVCCAGSATNTQYAVSIRNLANKLISSNPKHVNKVHGNLRGERREEQEDEQECRKMIN